MITAYNKLLRQLTHVEHSHSLKPASTWAINPIIEDEVALLAAPTDTWTYDEETTILRVSTPEELDVDPVRVETAKASQCAAMRAACEAEILAGFTSDALGMQMFYDGSVEDQLNLSSAILQASPQPGVPLGFSTFFGLRQSKDSPKSFKTHTFAQLRKVSIDGSNFRTLLLQRLNVRKAAIAACTRVSEVLTITWSD